MKAKTLITGALCLSVGAIVGREFGRIQFAKQLLDKLENEKDELESDDKETEDDEDVPYIFVIRAHSSNEGESL